MFDFIKTYINKITTSVVDYLGYTRKQLAPSNLNKLIMSKLFKDEKFDEQKSHQSVKIGDTNFVIAKASTDDLIKNNSVLTNGSGITLQEKIQLILKDQNLQNAPTKVLMPICQSQSYCFGIIKRAHFTYAQLEIDQDKHLKQAIHIDSKPASWLFSYDLSNIETSIKKAFPADKPKLEYQYQAKQSIFNNVDCGRFVINSIIQTVTGPKSGIKFDQIDVDIKQLCLKEQFYLAGESKFYDDCSEENIMSQ